VHTTETFDSCPCRVRARPSGIYICANVSRLCAIRDVSTKAGSDQVTDQMRSDPLLNGIFSTSLVLILVFGIFF